MDNPEVQLITVSGRKIEEFIPEIARLRIEVFRDFPYLYKGDLDYEKEYLQTYQNAQGNAFILALDSGRVVGASTCIPLEQETPEVSEPFLAHSIPIEKIMYFGESVLLKPYRGQGIGKAFFNLRESFAVSQGYTTACFCAVERPESHPLRPKDYQPLHRFWEKMGYTQQPDLFCFIEWQDLDQDKADRKKLIFWLKDLP
jgi:GNAT superfamily N-acetyltransferase